MVAQLVERSLLTPEIGSSNPNIVKNFIYQLYIEMEKDENKEKEAGNGPLKNPIFFPL